MFNRKTSRGISKFQAGTMLAMAVLGVTSLMPRARAADVTLTDTTGNLTTGTSWTGGVSPQATDAAVFGSLLTGVSNPTYTWAVGAGTSNNWAGIKVLNPGGNITINDPVNLLTLGTAGIDLSAATMGLTVNAGLVAGTSQTWSVGPTAALNVGGNVNLSTFALSINGTGNISITGGLLGTTATVTKLGTGNLTLSSQNTFTGLTTVGNATISGGALVLDFSGPSAPTSNILSSSLNISSSVLNVVGNAGAAVTQTFANTNFANGLTTLTSTSSGAGVTVNLGTITKTFNVGASVRIIPNAIPTLSTFTATNAADGTANGLVQAADTQAAANAGAYMTYGLSDYAGLTAGVIGPVSYTVQANGSAITASVIGRAYDLNGAGAFSATGIFIDAIRFSGAGAKTFTVTSGSLQLGGLLVTPDVGANDVTVVSGAFNIRAETNSDIVIWQNNTQGNLIITAALTQRGGTGSLVKNGAGTVVFTPSSNALAGNLFVNEGLIQLNSIGALSSATGTAIVLQGGGISINGTFTNANAAVQHPIRVAGTGGSINVTANNTFTISSSSNTAISGVALLTKTGPGTLALANTASTFSGGLAINGGNVTVTTTTGTPLGSGPVNVNSGGTLTASGIINTGAPINVNAGGFITAAPGGTLTSNFTVNTGGTYVTNLGTVSSTITLLAGASEAGTGTDIQARVIGSGVAIEPGTRGTVGTINFQNLTLQSGSILNLTLRGIPSGSDTVNVLSGGTLNLQSGIAVNMFDSITGASYFSNGSYQIFSGVDVLTAGKYVGGATQGALTNFVAANFNPGNIPGASATFSIVGGSTASSIWVTIAGGNNISNWLGSGGGNWTDSGNWTGGLAPGALSGDQANIQGNVLPGTIALGASSQHLGVLGIDSGTNSSSWTITATTGKLFMDNGASPASLLNTNGANTISANMDLLSRTTIALGSTAGSLTITGVINSPSTASTLTVQGTGTAPLILTADNTITAAGTIAANGTLQLGNNTATGSWGSGTLTDSGNLIVKHSNTFNLSSIAGRLVGTGTLTQAGSGQFIWDNVLTTGTFTGTVNVASGTVTVGAGTVWSPTGLQVAAGGTFDLGGNNMTFSTFAPAGVVTNISPNAATLNLTSTAAATLSGSLTNGAGALSILKTGSGALTLNGTNSYTGTFVIAVGSGVVTVANSTSLPAGSTIVSDVTDGLIFGPEVTVAANVNQLRDILTGSNFGWELPAGNATLTGNMNVGTAQQMRFRVQSAGTLTAKGVWSGIGDTTLGSVILFTNGNIVFSGTGAQMILGTTIDNVGETFFIGRSQGGGASAVANVTFSNGAQFINTTPTSVIGTTNGGNTLGGQAGGSGIQLGATGQTNAAQSLTVDHASILIGQLNFELEGQNQASTLTLTGGTIVAGSYSKTNNTAVTTFTVDGGLLMATQATTSYLPSASNLIMALGTGGAFIDTGGFSLGLGAPFSTSAGLTTDGGITFIGSGPVSFNGTGASYRGDTRISTNTLYAGADNVFSPNSALIFSGSGSVNAGGLSESVGGMDDQAATKFAVNFNSLTITPRSPNVYTFGGTITATNLAIAGSGTQILTNTATSWTGNTTLGGGAGLAGGRLIVGSATTPGLTITTSGAFGVAAGENTLVWFKGTAASAGLTAASMAVRQAGGVGNIVIADGTNGVDNFVKITGFTPGFIDQGTFFNGADYAYIDGTGGFFRAPVYGGADAGFLAANVLTSGNHILVTGSDTLPGASNFNTIKITGTGALNQAGNALTLNNAGILKAGGGSGSIIGGSLTLPVGVDPVIRVDSASDTLILGSNILDNATQAGGHGIIPLSKSGAGSLVLSGVNTFAGKLNLLTGTVVVANASALQNMLVNILSTKNPILFATGTTTAVFGGLIATDSPVGSFTLVPGGTLTLQTLTGEPVNLIVKISDSANPVIPTSSNGFNRVNQWVGLLTGPGSVTVQDVNNSTNGRYEFDRSANYTGGLTILSGQVSANQSVLGANNLDQSLGLGTVTLTGGTLTTRGQNVNVSFNNDFLFNGGGTLNVAGVTTGTATTFNGNLFGSGTITRIGVATLLSFNGSNNLGFTGTLINNAGSVNFLNGLPAMGFVQNVASTIEVFNTSGGTINIPVLAGTVSGASLRITMNNTAVTANFALNIGTSNVDSTFVGAITTTGSNNEFVSLTKMGTGNLTLGGASNFDGGVAVSGGTLTASFLDDGVLATTNAAAALGATFISLASTAGLATNMVVVGAGIVPGTTISALGATGMTLSKATTAIVANAAGIQLENRNPLGIGGSIALSAGTTLGYTGSGNSTVRTLVLGGSASLDASGTGAISFTNPGSISYSSPGSLVLTLKGSSTASNLLASQIVNNGTSSVGLVFSGTGLWTLSHSANTFSGGTTISSGELMITNATGNALGTGAVNLSSGGTLAGSGFTTAGINVNSGGHLGGGGTSLLSRLGTINLGGTLTLASGSILDFDMSLPGSPNDIINFFGASGSLIIPAVAGAVSVNLFNSNVTTNYFYNGTYNMFTGILAGNTTSISTALTAQALKVVNEPAGPSFVFSLAAGDPTRLILTIAGAWNNATWTNGSGNSQWSDAASNNWTGGIPNGSGNLANFLTNITTAQNITLVGSKTVTNLTFNNTNSFSIGGTDTLFLAAGSASGSLLTVATGSHAITAPISVSAAVLTVNAAAAGSVLSLRDLSGAGSLALTGSGSLVITGSATHAGGTSIAAASKLVVGNGTTGSLSGLIDNGGNLIFNHNDNISFAVSNLVQTSTTGTLTNAGTGVLTLQGILSGTASSVLVPGPIVVNAGTVKFDTDYMTNGNGTQGNTSVTLNAAGIMDLSGHTQQIRAFNSIGTLTNSLGTGTLFLSSTGAQSSSGVISGSLVLIKDGSGSITISGGTVNNTSLTILDGQVIFTNTNSTALSGLIIMARTDTTSAGLILGSGANVTTSALISAYNFQPQGNVEFVSPTAGSTATFSGNVSLDTLNSFGQQIRIGNANTSGTMVYAGTITVPNNITGLVTRNGVSLAGNGLILDQNQFSTFNIGTGSDAVGAAVNFNMTGNAQLLTSVADDNGSNSSVGLRLGNQGSVATATSTHTIAGNAYVRVGLNGASVYDLQPSNLTASAMSNTLNLNGGSIALARFYMQNGVNYANNPFGSQSQVNINFSGGTVIAGLSNNDLTMGSGAPFNMKFTVQAGGLTLDLNGKTNVQWGKPLTSGAPTGTTAAAFTDGGVKYVSVSSPATLTLATRQLYAGPTTLGPGATVIAGSSDVLGNPAAAAAVNFSGGVLRLSQSFALSSTDGGSTFLTHRFSFNDARAFAGDTALLDSVTSSNGGQLNSNATVNGSSGVLSMTGSAASATASILSVGDIGGANTNYTANGVSFAVWYTPAAQGSNAVLFSIGQNSPFNAGSQTGPAPTNYFMLTVASGSATGNIRAMLNVGGGEISASSAQPATGSEHLAVVTIDGSNLAVFVDGVLTQRVALSTLGGGDFIQNLLNGGGIYLGGSQFAADPAFNGSINEFRVYNSVLNNAYVNAMYSSGANTLAATAALNRNLTVDTSGGTLDLAGFRLDVGGNLSGAGTLTLRPGTLALTGNSSVGMVIPNGAKLLVGTGASGGALTGGTITNSDEIVFNRADAGGLLGATITGGTVTFNGSGTTTVSSASLPQVNLNAGNLMLTSSVNVTGLFTVAGGTGLGFTLGSASSVLALTGGYSHTGGAINVLAPGLGLGFDAGEFVVLTGAGTSLAGQFNAPAPANGYSYALDTATTGSLAIIVTSAWFNQLYWRSANADASWTNNANWSATSALDVSNASGSPLGPTTVIFNTTNSALATLATASVAHGLSFTGAGSAALGGTASAASLQLLGASALTVSAGAGAVTVNPAGGLLLSAATITNNGTSGLALGLILGTSLTLAGAGLTTLLTANTFTAGVNIAGNVKIANVNALGANALSVSGTLDLNGLALAPANFSGGSTGVITNNATAASTFTLNPVASVQTYGGHFAGNLALTKNGSGTLVLSGSSSHTGTTTVGGGKLLLGANNALSANSLLSLAASTTLDMGGFNATTGGLTGPATATITNSVAAVSTLTVNSTAGASTTFSGPILDGSGTLALVATGTGQLTLGSANAFSGGVTLLGGTLSATNPTAGSTTTSLGTGVFTLTGGTFRGQPSGNTNYVLANNLVANGNAGFNTSGSAAATLTGSLSGSGTLVRNGGSGALTFAGNNSAFHGLLNNESGNNVGNLVFVAPSAYPASDFKLTQNSTNSAIFQTTTATTVSIGALSGNSATAKVTIDSGTNVVATTLSVGSANANSTYQGILNSNSNNTMTLTKTGSGSFTLGSANTYTSTGALNVNAGTLAFSATGAARHTSAVLVQANAASVASGATLDLSNHDMLIHGGSTATLESKIGAAYFFGLWNKPGITSSTAQTNPITSLGIMSGADYNVFSPTPGTFDGVPVANTDTVIKFTYVGDLNLDGLVNDDDLFIFNGAYFFGGTGNYALGDLNFDGLVNDDDLFLFNGNYFFPPSTPLGGLGDTSLASAAAPAGGAAPVPEPASLVLLGMGATALLSRRKNRRRIG